MVKLFMFHWFLFSKCFINCLEHLCKGFTFLGKLFNKQRKLTQNVCWPSYSTTVLEIQHDFVLKRECICEYTWPLVIKVYNFSFLKMTAPVSKRNLR